MAEKNFIVKNGLKVQADATIDSDLTVVGSITGDTLTGEYLGFDSDLALKTTADLTEGSNLYYTDARVDSNLAANGISLPDGTRLSIGTDDDIVLYREGLYSNISFQTNFAKVGFNGIITFVDSQNSETAFGYGSTSGFDARFDGVKKFSTTSTGARIHGDLTIDSDLTANTITGAYQGFDSDFGLKTTGDLTEGSNLYYTKTRVDSDIDLRLISDPTIAGRVFYDQTGGSISIGEDTVLGDGTQSVLSFASDSDDATAAIAVGVKGQFNHAIGVTGSAASNDMVIGFEGTNTELKIKNNVGTGPFDLDGGTDLIVVGTSGDVSFKNTAEATSKTSASVKVAGGLGVDKNIRAQDIIAAGNVTATGTLFGTLSAASLSARSTDDLSEGSTNIYYTTARFDSDFGDNTTSQLTEGSNLYYTTARADSDAKNAISVNDGGGDGSLTYNATTGVISYVGPSPTEVRSHFTGGTGVTITNGSIAVGQELGTNDSVEFGGMTVSGDMVISGNLTVLGTQDVQSQTELSVSNAFIKVADSNTSDTVDIGIVGRYSDDGGTTIRRTGFIRDATNGEWYVFDGLVQDGIDSGDPTDQTINVNGTGWNLPTWNFGNLRGSYLGFDSDFAAFSSDYTVYDSDFTAVNAGRYAVDTSAGQVTVTLPANPSTGDYVRLIDVQNFSDNSVIVNRNGSTIEGYADNFELDLGQSIIEFIYINSNWQIYSSIGQRGPAGADGADAVAGDFSTPAQSIAFSVALG